MLILLFQHTFHSLQMCSIRFNNIFKCKWTFKYQFPILCIETIYPFIEYCRTCVQKIHIKCSFNMPLSLENTATTSTTGIALKLFTLEINFTTEYLPVWRFIALYKLEIFCNEFVKRMRPFIDKSRTSKILAQLTVFEKHFLYQLLLRGMFFFHSIAVMKT